MRSEKTMQLERAKNDRRPQASGRSCAPAGKYGQGAPLRRQNEDRFAVPASSCKRAGAMSDARRSERIGRAARFSERQLQAWVLDHREQTRTQRNRRTSSRA